MNKSFFLFICGFLICAVTMKVQAQVQEANSRYYRELQVDFQNGKYGLLFRNELVVPYEYDAIVAQKDNRGFISQQSDKYGIITVFIQYGDNTANMRQFSQQRQYFFEEEGRGRKAKGVNLSVMDISCEYDEIEFTNGNYWVSKGGLKGVFTSGGGTILRCEFNDIKFTNGNYWISKGEQKGVFTSGGGTILRCEFNDIKFTNGNYWAIKGDQKGVFTSGGGTILRCEFNDIKFINGNYWASKGNQKGVFTSGGGTILRCEFDKIELTSDNKYIAYKNGKKNLYSTGGALLHTGSDVIYSTE